MKNTDSYQQYINQAPVIGMLVAIGIVLAPSTLLRTLVIEIT